MNRRRLLRLQIYIVLVFFMQISLTFADRNSSWDEAIHKEYNNNVTVVYGKPAVDDVRVRTNMGFEMPVVGVTEVNAMLYNVPADGTEPVPLRQVPTLYITEGPNPVVIDESISANNMTRGLVFPGNPNPITLDDWLNGGDSQLILTINDVGDTIVEMKIKGLLPNSFYGVWQFNQSGGAPGPFGGIPNVFVTDYKGEATMQRMLPFNVHEIVDHLLVVYHSDHRIYGGTPSLINPLGGHDIHVQLKFQIMEAQ